MAKYGDRVLETIEATIKEHYKEKGSSSSNDSTDSKRRRDAINASNLSDDFTQTTARTKKRMVKKQSKNSQAIDVDQFDDIDFSDDLFDVQVSEVDNNNGGRVLPSWSTNGA